MVRIRRSEFINRKSASQLRFNISTFWRHGQVFIGNLFDFFNSRGHHSKTNPKFTGIYTGFQFNKIISPMYIGDAFIIPKIIDA